jgi:hypothetical protein
VSWTGHACRCARERRHRRQVGRKCAIIRAELELEAVLGLALRARHHAGVVDQHVDARVLRENAFGEGRMLASEPSSRLLELTALVAGRRVCGCRRRPPRSFGTGAGGEGLTSARGRQGHARSSVRDRANRRVTSATLRAVSYPSRLVRFVVVGPKVGVSHGVLRGRRPPAGSWGDPAALATRFAMGMSKRAWSSRATLSPRERARPARPEADAQTR